uniref:NAD(P)H-quinone oxidoreductase subunit 6, chloroplastic n=1 Tax=Flatbergium sericeum TaxID=128237 RepID=A0A172N8F9_9BRYO|nr:subunit 6 of NADH-plastoquinone oxidoreductase [Flatbergium sericeum]
MIKSIESLHEILFLFLEVGLILGSLGVVILTNIVYSAFFLGLVFVCISPLYLLLNADFVATAQILIYVGAINILIVFAVMLINKPQSFLFFPSWTTGDGITCAACTGLFFLLITTISNTSWSEIYLVTQSNNIVEQDLGGNIQRVGYLLLTEFLLPFELLSIVLLVALIGAITIARREKRLEIRVKSQALQAKEDFPTS